MRFTGLLILGIFLAIVGLDVALYVSSYPTISEWFVTAAHDHFVPVACGVSFFWGFLSGHFLWGLKPKRK